jgi:outer membrane protein TolC
MQRIVSILCLAIAMSLAGGAQTQPPATVPPAQEPVNRLQAPSLPASEPRAPTSPALTLNLTLDEALTRARAYASQLLSADIGARLAHEDRVQAKAALLPSATWQSGFIYTQPNGSDSGVFVPNDGPRVYLNTLNAHAEIYAPGKRADYQSAIAAEAVAYAKVEIARRGLDATVLQNYYGMVVAQRKLANARQSLEEVRRLLDITQKQEQGGEAAHSDVVKSMIQVDQRSRDMQDAELNMDKARIGFAVFLFPDYRQDFAVVDDLERASMLPPFPEVQALAQQNNPDIRAAQALVTQQRFGIRSARSALLPTLTFDYWYGMEARQYALHDELGHNLWGSSFQAQLNVPLWNWGATRSRIKQAELHLEQARNDLSLTQRQLLANLDSFYREAQVASSQMTSLKRSLDLSEESLKLTLLRYQAGEVSILELVDAQSTLVAARNAHDDGLVRYRLALASLQTLTGAF